MRVRGAVQGVGFRPYVHSLAERLSLDGFVRNDAQGLLLEVEGSRIAEFVDTLRREPPPLARVDDIHVESIEPTSHAGFSIEASRRGVTQTRIVADAAVCDACLDELFDPANRFHLYPFINCTHCGTPLYHNAVPALRSAAYLHVAISDVRRLRARLSRSC